jgi:hypothetical protein
MENLYIERTDRTPLIEFTDGKLSLWGTFVPEYPAEFYLPLHEWVKKYSTNPAPETILNIGIIYTRQNPMNYLQKFLRELIELNDDHHRVTINWFYCMNSIDKKAGEYLSRKLNYLFNFVEFEGIW